MTRLLLSLAVLAAVSSPATAEDNYTVRYAGHGWWRVTADPVTLPTPEGRWGVQVILWLDDVPGWTGMVGPTRVVPLAGVPGGPQKKAHLSLSVVGNAMAGGAVEPYVTLTLRDHEQVRAGTYRISVDVPGRWEE